LCDRIFGNHWKKETGKIQQTFLTNKMTERVSVESSPEVVMITEELSLYRGN
jgi:hypothetical protein